jgi:transketolase
MRREFGKTIKDLIDIDKSVHMIFLDTGFRIFDKIKEEYPGHLHNFGVTEQASIGVASGMALEGLRPYLYTITPFILERPYEQIKLDLVEQNANVKLAGFWDYPNDGPTHITKNIKKTCETLGIKLYEPKNARETREMILEDYYNNYGPAFFSLTIDR